MQIQKQLGLIVPEIVKRVVNNEETPSPLVPVRDQVKHKLMIEDQSGGDFTENQWTTVVKSDTRKRLHKVPVSNSILC